MRSGMACTSFPLIGEGELSERLEGRGTVDFARDLPYSISISDIRFPLRSCFAALRGAYSSLKSQLDIKTALA